MLVEQPSRIFRPRTRLLIAGGVGMGIALLATGALLLPTLAIIGYFFQLAPLGRAAVLAKLLSPLLCFLLAGAWTLLLLRIAEQVLLRRHAMILHTSARVEPQDVSWSPRLQPDHSKASPKERQRTAVERERLRALPPLFQLDPSDPFAHAHLSVAPPLTPALENGTKLEQVQEDNAVELQQTDEYAQDQALIPTEDERAPTEQGSQQTWGAEPDEIFVVREPKSSAGASHPVHLTLLKEIRCHVRADDGTSVEVKLRKGENGIRLILFAYIAWRRGEGVDRDKILTHVLSRGKRRDQTTDQLGETFDSAKRYLRADLSGAVEVLKHNGHPVSADLNFFSTDSGFYSLHSTCVVDDLEQIEAYSSTIQLARKEGLLDEKLDGSLPGWVLEACQKLIERYTGDFLQILLEKFPDEFGIWVKEPVTLYRDRYLDALLILANYESALGRKSFDETLSFEENEEQRRAHIGKAAQLFSDYATCAISSRWDSKLKFAHRAGKDGERVVQAARAIRRCVVELGKLGKPDMIDQTYLTFKERMSRLSEGTWKPDKDTESDVAEAKRSTTNAYRFSSQLPGREDGNKK